MQNEWAFTLMPQPKRNARWIHAKSEPIKLKQKCRKLHDIGWGRFFEVTSKAQPIKTKKDKWDCVKPKRFCIAKQANRATCRGPCCSGSAIPLWGWHTHGCWFPSQLLHFGASSLLTHLADHWRMSPLWGSLPFLWETWRFSLLPSAPSSPGPSSQVGSQLADEGSLSDSPSAVQIN